MVGGDAQTCTCILNLFVAKDDDLVGTGKYQEFINLPCDAGAQEKFRDYYTLVCSC